ncbi:hypothetical protein KGR20_19060 [Cytobacillus oceanisediminis]|uniref:phage tail protein n=1 Tax=Cytobacillus oceanisediminis TaxID=665099 RepID=UPI001CCBDB38|nr:hypothetical protein [Cytobacillus oceanisediminis]MBZ9536278.1 hypothetical protein [Cytobacillus oceanisediminis]
MIIIASRIKGITIELGADTTSLEGALSDVNKKSKNLATELKDVEKLLKFNPNSVELLAQKQQILSESVETTRKKLDQLKEAEAQVQQQFERGDIKEEQYRAFQRELKDTERSLERFENALQDMQVEQDKVGQSQKDLATLMSATETSIEDYADAIGHRLVRSIQNGTATSRDLERAIQRIGREALGADVDVDRLTTTLRSVDDGNSLQQVRRELQRLGDQAEETTNALEELDYGIENVAGALVAGGGIAGAIDEALSNSNLDTKIDIILDVPEASKSAIKQSILDVTAVLEDEEGAIAGVRRQFALNKDASDEANQAIIDGAVTIAKAYEGIDFTELIQETNEISSELKITDDQALGLINSLLKVGFPPEQLDIIAEYGQQLHRAGMDAEEIQAIMKAGVETGTWNIDNLLDGLKEGRVRMAEFASTMNKDQIAIASSVEGGIEKFDEWALAISEGGKKGSKAMVELAKAIDKMEGSAKNDLGTMVFGTMFEDQGQNIIDTIVKADSSTVDLGKNIKQLGEATERLNEDPAVKLQKAFADLKIALQPLLSVIAAIIAAFSEWVTNNPKLAATITALGTVIGIVSGLILALAPIFFVLQSAAASAGVGIGTLIAPFLTMAGIVLGIITVIGLLIAAFVNLYQNNEDFRNKVQEIWASIQEVFFNVLNYIKELVSTIMTEVMTFFGEVLGKIKAFWDENGQAIMILVEMYMNYIKGIIEIIMIVIKGLFQAGWTAITTILKIAWELIKSIVKTGIDLVLGIIQTVLKLLQGDWEGAWNTIKDTVKSIWNNIKEFFENVDLLQTGKNIIQGLISGIGSMAGAVWDKVTEIGQSIKDGFTSFFDIHSPSRLMRDDIGKNIGLGLKEGLEEAESKVYNASRNLQEAAKPEISKNNQSNVMSNPYDDSEVISLLRKIASKNLTIDSNALMDFINTRQANEINFINAMKG